LLIQIAATPVKQLQDRTLDANDFYLIAGIDVSGDILRWMGDPKKSRERLGSRWNAFCRSCQKELDFDPAHEADVVAGAQLGNAKERWAKVWERFEEARILGQAFPTSP